MKPRRMTLGALALAALMGAGMKEPKSLREAALTPLMQARRMEADRFDSNRNSSLFPNWATAPEEYVESDVLGEAESTRPETDGAKLIRCGNGEKYSRPGIVYGTGAGGKALYGLGRDLLKDPSDLGKAKDVSGYAGMIVQIDVSDASYLSSDNDNGFFQVADIARRLSAAGLLYIEPEQCSALPAGPGTVSGPVRMANTLPSVVPFRLIDVCGVNDAVYGGVHNEADRPSPAPLPLNHYLEPHSSRAYLTLSVDKAALADVPDAFEKLCQVLDSYVAEKDVLDRQENIGNDRVSVYRFGADIRVHVEGFRNKDAEPNYHRGFPEVALVRPLAFTADNGEHLRFPDDFLKYFDIDFGGENDASPVKMGFSFPGGDGAVLDMSDISSRTRFDHEFVGKDILTGDYSSLTVTLQTDDGREKSWTFPVTVLDSTAPVIGRKDGLPSGSKLRIGTARKATADEILSMYTAEDSAEGDVTGSLRPASDGDAEFFDTHRHPGEGVFSFTASDTSGNIASQAVTVSFEDELPSVVIAGDSIVYAGTDAPLDAEALSEIANALLPKERRKESTVAVTDDGGYHLDPMKEGEYYVTYSVTDLDAKDGKKTGYGSYRLINRERTKKEEKSAFVLFFQKLKNWFRGVFTKFRFDCFVTDGEWDARYPAEK